MKLPEPKLYGPIALVAVAIILTGVLSGLVWREQPTSTEIALLQITALTTGLAGSYVLGRYSAAAAAREVISPHAKSALRRVMDLLNSLYRLSYRINAMQETAPNHQLDIIQAVVTEQISRGIDAIEDWRDIVPDEVKEIERIAQGRSDE